MWIISEYEWQNKTEADEMKKTKTPKHCKLMLMIQEAIEYKYESIAIKDTKQ